jgi:competence ComEA-like helix-hairpin-helix protein
MDEHNKLLDVNAATVDELMTLPGIGPAMASRIIAARPFISLEDLQRVSGIGPAALERIAPLVSLSSLKTEAIEAESQSKENIVPEALPSEAPEPVIIEQPAAIQHEEPQSEALLLEAPEPTTNEQPEAKFLEEKPTEVQIHPPETPIPEATTPGLPQKQRKTVTLTQAVSLAFASGFLSFILSIGLIFFVLSLINGGLRFVTPAEMDVLKREVSGLKTQNTQFQQNLDGMRTRLDNLDSLSGRFTAIEKDAKQLRNDLDAATGLTKQMAKQVDTIQADIQELRTNATRFQNFLEGLRNLLNKEAGPNGN